MGNNNEECNKKLLRFNGTNQLIFNIIYIWESHKKKCENIFNIYIYI